MGDNPIFLPDDKVVLTGANFQGSPISVPLDMMGACVTMACVISERRLNRLLNPALSVGLPAFLTKGAGMYLRPHAQPVHGRHADRRAAHPVDARLDPVDPGRRRPGRLRLHGHEHGAQEHAQIIDNAYGVLGIEFIAAAQALDFRDFKPGKGTLAAKEAVRKVVAHLGEDRPLYPDHNAMMETVKKRDILHAVESAIGELKTY